ncbi:MAG TPA: antibiotic biosynthesis monooxygenase [Steroidobacteraceae bacterium]|nr:antibiotic biosynthesis monooxygenase [Steroidobacteraceae bacterium]
MILEIATLTTAPARRAEFEAAFAEARKVITQAEGCGSVQLQRSIENPGRYILTVQWPSVAHHMEGFRGSPLFVEWRRILGPFFTAPPSVEHGELVN